MRPRTSRPVIHKFGGAALADAAAIRRTITTFLNQPSPRVMVVSALSGVTDLLLTSMVAAVTNTPAERQADAAAFDRRHQELATALGLRNDDPWCKQVRASTAELATLLDQVATGGCTPALRDLVAARGELLSAALLGRLLLTAGVAVEVVAPTELIVTSGPHGEAIPDRAKTRSAVQQCLTPLLTRGITPVVPGFLGRGPGGQVVTLGRGGTDLTATLLARALEAERVVLWKDVPGLLTADPRLVPEARLLAEVHRLEAAEMAWYGAKVLHPRALDPLTGTRIPVEIRGFAEPDSAGTLITASLDTGHATVRALAAVQQQTLLTVTGGGVAGVPAVASQVFETLSESDITVALITQASAEAAIDFIVPTSRAGDAVRLLRQRLRGAIQRGDIDGVERQDQVAVVAVVGLGMASHPGIAARVFEALSLASINVRAIAQGSGERNISVVLKAADAASALRVLHAAFQLDKIGGGRPVRLQGRDIILLGAGTIGRTVMELLAAHPKPFASLRVVAVLDSAAALVAKEGVGPEELRRIARFKADGGALAEWPGALRGDPMMLCRQLGEQALARPILVDMTASDTSALLLDAARRGWDIVLANKKPLAASSGVVEELHAVLRQQRAKLRCEATVGAGLPILESLQQLLATGDEIRSLEGCLSGTLGTVLSALQAGVPFSAAVNNALARGFTEPDPRDDLGGIDVARKALILARTLGLRLELSEIPVDSLVGDGGALPLHEWLAALPQGDAAWAERVEAAKAAGEVLRYVARVTPAGVSVGLRALPRSHPLAQLQGAANQLVLTSARYAESPLVITGPGAGPEVTATGVLADLLALK